MTLPSETTISFVRFNVRNLDAICSFYTQLLGFRVIGRTESTARLSASGVEPATVILEHRPDAPSRSPDTAGLYHVAYLFPDRKSLAQAFLRLYQQEYMVQGFADHGVSEALYLADPEGNGIELYADRPRTEWRYRNGALEMFTAPLDIENLIATLGPSPVVEAEANPAVRIGHIHLQVSNLTVAERFYHELVGFDVVQRSYPGALFVSAGGYHHHLGLNIWNSRGRSAPAEGTVGLASFGIGLPHSDSIEQIRERLVQVGRPIRRQDNHSFATNDFDGIAVTIHLTNQFIS
jgi:catechol 2,3-dioxygenase